MSEFLGIYTTPTIDGMDTSVPVQVFDFAGPDTSVMPTAFYFRLESVSGVVLGVSTVSVGTNAPDYDNILAPTLLSGLNVVNEVYHVNVNGIDNLIMIPGSGSIAGYLRIRTAAIATSYWIGFTMTGIVSGP